MEKTEMAAERRRRVRLFMMKVLATEHPMPVDEVILRRCLANFGYPLDLREFASNAAYLAERGYVKREERKRFGIAMIVITANGLEVLDGRIQDPGVDSP
jgi:hypothetical protein